MDENCTNNYTENDPEKTNFPLNEKIFKEEVEELDFERINNINDNANVFNIHPFSEYNYFNNPNQNKSISKRKIPIFEVIHRKRHGGEYKDNSTTCVITGFFNFLIFLINLITKIKINKDRIFQISFKIKSMIKIKDLGDLIVEQLLFNYQKIIKSNKDSNKIVNLRNEHNINQYNKIKNEFGPFLDELFKTKVIDIFRDIYCKKDFEEIELKKYGVEGITFKIDEKTPTYEKLKNKYKDNIKKINKMNEIKYEIINLKKNKFILQRK